jgi:hypothetical protein
MALILPRNRSSSQPETRKNRPSTVFWILVVLTSIFYLPIWIRVHTNGALPSSSIDTELGVPSSERFRSESHGIDRRSRQNQATGSTSLRTNNKDQIQDLEDRIRYLETKLNAYLAFTSDPFLSNKHPAICNNARQIKDLACVGNKKCALDNQMICLDTFPNLDNSLLSSLKVVQQQDAVARNQIQECIVYDFGIRESPEYGLAFSKAPFDCHVVGFDPSPISIEWWEKNEKSIRENHPKYDFMGVGAGGVDGPLELHEYDWGQVSILQYPRRVIDTNNCTSSGCKYKFYNQKSFTIPVKTLKTIMAELGHKHLTLLKLVSATN